MRLLAPLPRADAAPCVRLGNLGHAGVCSLLSVPPPFLTVPRPCPWRRLCEVSFMRPSLRVCVCVAPSSSNRLRRPSLARGGTDIFPFPAPPPSPLRRDPRFLNCLRAALLSHQPRLPSTVALLFAFLRASRDPALVTVPPHPDLPHPPTPSCPYAAVISREKQQQHRSTKKESYARRRCETRNAWCGSGGGGRRPRVACRAHSRRASMWGALVCTSRRRAAAWPPPARTCDGEEGKNWSHGADKEKNELDRCTASARLRSRDTSAPYLCGCWCACAFVYASRAGRRSWRCLSFPSILHAFLDSLFLLSCSSYYAVAASLASHIRTLRSLQRSVQTSPPTPTPTNKPQQWRFFVFLFSPSSPHFDRVQPPSPTRRP